jgi:hypothetical protein
MGRLLVPAVVLTACMLPAASFGQPPSPSPLDPEWRLVAEADLIVRARLEAPKVQLERAIQTGKGDHELLTLHVAEVVKGPPGIRTVQCAYWTGPQSYMPSPTDVLALDGREVLAFVHRGFLLQAKGAIRRVEPGKAEQLRKEALNQRAIAKDFARLPAARPDEFEGTVRRLINKMLAEGTQQQAVYELQRLDRRAAPSVIRQMDDRRTLPDKHTQFINTHPHGFEGILHYSPKVVVDALATVLGDLTDESFGQIYNGGTEDERRQVVDAWRVYLHYHMGSKAKARPSSPALPKQSPSDKHP